jgi:hypothetical protein
LEAWGGLGTLGTAALGTSGTISDSYAGIEHEDDVVFPSHVMTLFLEHDIEDVIRDSKMRFDEQEQEKEIVEEILSMVL